MSFTPAPVFVTRNYALAVLEYLEQAGHRPEAVYDAACLAAVRQEDGAAQLPLALWRRVLLQAVDRLQDPALPFKLAQTIKLRHLGLLGFLLASCPDLGAAARVLQRYELLFDGVNLAVLEPGAEHFSLTWVPRLADPPAEFAMLAMSLWITQARWLSEHPELGCEAHFAFAPPRDAAVLACAEQTFGGPVRFGMPCSRLIGPMRYLSLPLPHRDPQVHASLREQADSRLLRQEADGSGLLQQLEGLLERALPHGAVSLEDAARALSLPPRTLQSRLDRHGLNYREVLDSLRMRLAARYLRESDRPLAEIAALLGFADQSSFQHAFRRWAGTPPGQWRRRAEDQPATPGGGEPS